VGGNSVRGQLTASFLSERLGLHLFASMPTSPVQMRLWWADSLKLRFQRELRGIDRKRQADQP